MTLALALIVTSTPIGILLIKYPEIGVALILVLKPELTGFLTRLVGDSPIKSLIINAIIMICILAHLFKEKKLRILYNPVLVTAIVFALWLVYGTTYTSNPINGYVKLQKYILENIFITLIPTIFYNDTGRFERFIKIVFVLGWLLPVLSILSPSVSFSDNARLAPGWSAPIQFGRIAAVTTFTAIALYFLYARKTVANLLYLFYVPVGLALIVFTGSKGPILALFVAVAIFLSLYTFKVGVFRAMPKTSILGILLIVGALWLLPQIPTEVFDRLFVTTDYFLEGSVLVRQYQLQKSTWMFLNSPLIGYGTGSFEWDLRADYPHNILAEILSENGLIGFSIFIFMIAFSLKSAYTVLNQSQKHIDASNDRRKHVAFMISLFTLYFVASLFSLDIPGNNGIWFSSSSLYVLCSSADNITDVKYPNARYSNNWFGSNTRPKTTVAS